MEQVKTQMSMADKLKRYTIMPLLAMSVFMGGLSSNAHADPLDAKQMDAETVSKTLHGINVTGTISKTQKDEVLEAFEEKAKLQKLPKEITSLVTKDTILDYELNGNKTVMYMDKGTVIYMIKGSSGKYTNPAINLYDVQPHHIAEPLPPVSKGINSKTKKPYFSVPKNLAAKLSAEDKTYLKSLYKVMNTNFGTLMQLGVLDEKKIKKNEYAGKIPDLSTLWFGEIPNLEQGMNEIEIKLRRQLGFIINGAVEAIKAGGKIKATGADCTGWTYHSIMFNNELSNYLVYNGRYNSKGTLAQYRTFMINRKIGRLKLLQKNFHALMQENGVGLDMNAATPGLTPKQQVLVNWNNAFNNYILDLFYKKNKTFSVDNQKVKALDQLLDTENILPPQKIKEIPNPNSSETAKADIKPIYMARLSCDYTK